MKKKIKQRVKTGPRLYMLFITSQERLSHEVLATEQESAKSKNKNTNNMEAKKQ